MTISINYNLTHSVKLPLLEDQNRVAQEIRHVYRLAFLNYIWVFTHHQPSNM